MYLKMQKLYNEMAHTADYSRVYTVNQDIYYSVLKLKGDNWQIYDWSSDDKVCSLGKRHGIKSCRICL